MPPRRNNQPRTNEARIREIAQKFQGLTTIAVLVGTVIWAGLITLPGGYYDDQLGGGRSNTTFPGFVYYFFPRQANNNTLYPFSGTPKADMASVSEAVKADAASPPSSDGPKPHSTGESKLSRELLFVVFMRLSALTIIASFAIPVFFVAARGEDLRRWENAYLICRAIAFISSFSCFIATFCLMLFIVGDNGGLAMDISVMGCFGALLTIVGVVKVWYY